MSGPVIVTHARRYFARYGLHWIHALPGGRLVPKDQVSWRTIAGVWIHTSRGQLWLHFRRWPR